MCFFSEKTGEKSTIKVFEIAAVFVNNKAIILERIVHHWNSKDGFK